MQYVNPFGINIPDAPYVDRNTPGATNGSKVGAKAIEHPMREIVAAIEAAGLTPDGEDLGQLAKAIAYAGIAHGVSIFATAGSHTFVAPQTRWYWPDTYGGGGGAANSGDRGEGGGGGGYAGTWVFLEQGETVPLTVGAAGVTNGTGTANGTAGGTSSFGAHCSATGGGGATFSGVFGAGGMGSGGAINLRGQDGTNAEGDFPKFGEGGAAAGPHGGKPARNGENGATWPGGGGSRAWGWDGQPAAGGIIVRW